jgi:hypothetical protein
MSIKLRNPKSVSRKRIYDTAALALGGAVVWGIIDAGDAAAITESLEEIVGIGVALLARFNVTDSE